MTYPKLAFNKPPKTSPQYNANSSVPYNNKAAKGIIAMKFRTKTIVLGRLHMLAIIRDR